MHALRATTGIRRTSPLFLGNPPHDALGAGGLWEPLIKDLTVAESLLGLRRVFGVDLCPLVKLLVGNHGSGKLLEGVDPRVADAVRELFFLAPQDLVG